jgi:hypothetical protein
MATVVLLQGQMLAASHACGAGRATAESATWNFPKEGSELLKDIGREAWDVRTEAATLEEQARNVRVDWQTHAAELTTIRNDINHMGRQICRLETIREQLTPEQRSAVDETAQVAKKMATFTQDAIVFLNGHHENLWNPEYYSYLGDLHREAKIVNHAVKLSREG